MPLSRQRILFCSRVDSEYHSSPRFRLDGEDLMTFMNINLLAVLAAAVATMVVGFLWYSPLLFARPWMVAMGYDPEDKSRMKEIQKSAGKSYAISFVASLVSAFVLAKIIYVTTVDTALYGMKVGFAVWLGFVTTVQLTAKVFGNQSTKLYLINTGYQLICYLVMGVILAVWPW
jgi:hypothetical protein